MLPAGRLRAPAPPYPAATIAKWFVAYAQADEADVSNLKIQKLLYYAQGHHLAETGAPLFNDPIEAWSHGPVVRSVYREFKSFGSGDVQLAKGDPFRWEDVDEPTTNLLIQVWETYGQYAAWRLRAMTHSEAPWRNHFSEESADAEISQDEIKAQFAGRP